MRDASSLCAKEKADFAASFQRAAVTAVIKKLKRAMQRHPEVRSLLVGGGVSANSRLRTELTSLAKHHEIDLRLPRMDFCLDNAAMIAGLAHVMLQAGRTDDWTLSASAQSSIVAA